MGLKYQATGTLIGLTLLSLISVGCGAPSYCKHEGVSNYLDNEWRTYCAAYITRVERPGQFEIQELTRFFAHHDDRAEELRQRQEEFQDVSACFETPREKLEYRSLASCLNPDKAQKIRIDKAWQARADAWLQGYEALSHRMGPRFEALQREASRLMRKAKESFEYQVAPDPGDFIEWQSDLQARSDDLARLSTVQEKWRSLVETARGNDALRKVMFDGAGPRVARLSEDVLEYRDALIELQILNQYLENALKSAGHECPDGIQVDQEDGIARSVLKKKIESIDGGVPKIETEIRLGRRDEHYYEVFSGFVCAKRGEDRQIGGEVELCAKHRFVLERKWLQEQRKWKDWTLKSFEEGGPEDSVDCSGLK